MKQEVLQMLKCINKDLKKVRLIIQLMIKIIREKIGKQKLGRKRTKLAHVLAGILYYTRTGCTWRALPPVFGNYRTIYGWFQRIAALDIFKIGWDTLMQELVKKGKINLKRFLVDGSLTCFSGSDAFAKRTPRNRNKKSINRILTTDSAGLPLHLILAPGSAHDSTFIDSIVDKLAQKFTLPAQFHLHGDKGFYSLNNIIKVRSRGGFPHFAEPRYAYWTNRSSNKDKHRWKIERSIAWNNRFQALVNILTKRIDHLYQLFYLSFVLILSRNASYKNIKNSLRAIK